MSASALTLLGMIIAWLAAVIAAYAVLGDWIVQRFKHRRRCPKCWYDMSQSLSLTCSECGYTAKRERKLFKGRWRWKLVWLALFMLLGSHALRVTPAVRQRGWVAAVPTTALIVLAPVDRSAWSTKSMWEAAHLATPQDQLLVELFGRCERREPQPWQWQILLSRFFSQNPEQIGHLVQTREEWPRGLPIAVTLKCGFVSLLGQRGDLLVRVRLPGSNTPWAERVNGSWSERVGPSSVQPILGMPAIGAADVYLDVEIMLGLKVVQVVGQVSPIVDLQNAYVVWSGNSRSIPVNRPIEDVMHSVHTDGENNFIKSLPASLLTCEDGSVKLGLRYLGWHFGDGHEDWSWGATAQILRDGDVVAEGRMLYPMTHPGLLASQFDLWTAFDLEWRSPAPISLRKNAWTVRLKPSAEVAVYDLERDTYFAAEITLPICGIESYHETLLDG